MTLVNQLILFVLMFAGSSLTLGPTVMANDVRVGIAKSNLAISPPDIDKLFRIQPYHSVALLDTTGGDVAQRLKLNLDQRGEITRLKSMDLTDGVNDEQMFDVILLLDARLSLKKTVSNEAAAFKQYWQKLHPGGVLGLIETLPIKQQADKENKDDVAWQLTGSAKATGFDDAPIAESYYQQLPDGPEPIALRFIKTRQLPTENLGW